MPDLVLAIDGVVYFLEIKGVLRVPKNLSKNLLNHPFSGPQIATMRKLVLAGCFAWGVVGIKEKPGSLWAMSPFLIPRGGNFTFEYMDRNALMLHKEGTIWPINHLATSPKKMTDSPWSKKERMLLL